MNWEELKVLLVRLDMTVTDLAKEIGCARPSIYLAFSRRDRPKVMKKIEKFYNRYRAYADKYIEELHARKSFPRNFSVDEKKSRRISERL